MAVSEFNGSVTVGNEDLLHELQKEIAIHFEIDNKADCWTATKVDYKAYLIEAPDGNASPEGLTHELLHIQLERNGLIDLETLEVKLIGIGLDYIQEYANHLAHMRFIQEYLSRGFDKNRFTSRTPEAEVVEFIDYLSDRTNKSNAFHYAGTLI